MPCSIFVIGQNAWIKLEVHMVFVIYDVNLSSYFCKKKYKTILTIYRNDKKMHEILGQGKLPKCKWFHEMYLLYESRASVKNLISKVPQKSLKILICLLETQVL
jgi:hypothetical protein